MLPKPQTLRHNQHLRALAATKASLGSCCHKAVTFPLLARPKPETLDLQPLLACSLAPLAPGLLLSPFDLQLPFTHWTATEYVTTERRRRPANVYAATNLAGQTPAKVTFAIDRVYGVLVEATCFDVGGDKTRSMQVDEFSKVGEQWMLAACSVRDEVTRDCDLLRITEAALDARIPPEVFTPASLARPAPRPAGSKKL